MCLRVKAFALTGRGDSTMQEPQGVASLALGYVFHWAFSPPLLNSKLELRHSHISTLRNMLVLILSLIVLCVIAAIAGWLRNRSLKRQLERGEIDEMPHIKKRPEGCCGKHAVCEKDEMAAALAQPIEYFDDEELDSFKGRPSDSYTPQEVEQFEEVMTTMQPQEVAAWLRSLQLRSVNLPDDLKDEAMLLMEE